MKVDSVLWRAILAPASRHSALILLVPTLAIGLLYIAIGAQVREIATNDGAYYFGVARHMALTGRFEEPIVWHFMYEPDALTHPPFDHWGCLTSLLLVPSLWLFGATTSTAFLTMSVVSAIALLAFWYLICVALPLRYGIVQCLALGLFAFSPVMVEYRFQPESITVAQLAILLAIIAVARRRYVLAVLSAFAILLSRSDGLILFLIVSGAALLAALRERPAAPRRPLAVVAALVLCSCLYVGWSWASFGTATPPGQRVLPFLTDYWQMYHYGIAHPHSWRDVLTRFEWPYIAERIDLVRLWAPLLFFTPHPLVWFALVALPGLLLFRARPFVEGVIWTMAVGGLLAVIWASGPAFFIGRTPVTFTPLIILAGALGVDAVLSRVVAWADGRTGRRAVAALGMAGFCLYFFLALPAPGVTATTARPSWQLIVGRLAQQLGGQPSASNLPWYMLAYTDSPTVSIPHNGEAAVEAVLRRYGIRWLVLKPHQIGGEGESEPLLRALVAGTRSSVGSLQLQRVPGPPPLIVFRVDDPSADGELVGGEK